MTLTKIASTGVEDSLRWVLGANGTSDYTFTGPGLTGTVNDPTIYLTRGHTYIFQNNSGGHPFYIKTSIANGGTNDAYNTGVTNNGGGNGTEIVFTVPHDSPDILYYQCSSHASMAGQFNIAGSVADGSITTAKIADDAVTNDKLANSVVASIAANTAKTSNATHTGDVTGSTSLTIANQAVTTAKLANDAVDYGKLADGAVLTAKIANNAVTTGKIADEAVTLAKLPHGTSSNDGKFLRANNGADPTFESLPASGLSNIVEDTSPQLGGDLDTNGHEISLDDAHKIKFGNSNDLTIEHDGGNSYISDGGTGDLIISSNRVRLKSANTTEDMLRATENGSVELYTDNLKQVETFHGNAGASSDFTAGGLKTTRTGNHNSNIGYYCYKDSNLVARLSNHGSGPEGSLVLYNQGVQKISMNGTNGTLTLHGNAGYIQFGDTGSAAHRLDDYEEGTFTLTLSKHDGSAEVSGGTMNYTKIGRWVNCWGQVTFGNASASIGGSHCYMKGWPFYVGSNSSNDVGIWVWNNGTRLQSMDVTLASMSVSTTSNIWGMYVHTYNNAPSITGSQMGNGARVSLGYSYEAS